MNPECSHDIETLVSEGKLALRLLRISLLSHGGEGSLRQLLAMTCLGLIAKQEARDPPGYRERFLYELGSRVLRTLANVNISA